MSIRTLILLLILAAGCFADGVYILGPEDQIVVRALDLPEFPNQPMRIDARGMINLPLLGRIEAGGNTIEQLEAEITIRLKKYQHAPQVVVSVAEFRSRPVSVFGAVARPGVMQLRGPKTLWEVLSEAGGLKNDVGKTIKITRRAEHGPLPLEDARVDETGKFIVAEVDVQSLREMADPDENIELMEQDVVSVSTADVVYVVGHVNRSGGFVTNGSISLLEALSLSGGFKQHAAAKKARILRVQAGTDQRQVIAVNLKHVLRGDREDIALKPQDILFVPHDAWKDFGIKLVTAATGAATGAAIYAGIRY